MYSISSIFLHFILSILAISAAIALLWVIAVLIRAEIRFCRDRAVQRKHDSEERQRQAVDRERRVEQGYQNFQLTPGKQSKSARPYTEGGAFRIDINRTIKFPFCRIPGSNGLWKDLEESFMDAHAWGRASTSPSLWEPHLCLYIDDSSIPAIPFENQGHLHRHSFYYVGTGERLTLFLERPKALAKYKEVTGSLSVTTTPLSDDEANQIRKQTPIEAGCAHYEPAPTGEVETENAVSRHRHPLEFYQRAYTLSHTYENPAYEDDAWVEAYGKQYCHDLLKRKHDIIAAHLEFHSDREFADYLYVMEPDVYKRATWEHRALSAAERYIVESTERRRPAPTPEQFRERMVRRLQVQAQDHIRRAVEVETAVQQYRHTLEELDLDEDEIEEKLQHFKDILIDEGDDNGSFASL